LNAAANADDLRGLLRDEISASPAAFRHSGWSKARQSVKVALVIAGISASRRRRFDECGAKSWVVHDKCAPGTYRLIGNYCRDRWCLPCGRARSVAAADRFKADLQLPKLRFVTLTVRSVGRDLAGPIAKLFAGFRDLKKAPLWKACVKGGVAFLEVKWNPGTSRWHPHLHCLVDGKYLPQKALSALWLQITGDSYIVDVRSVVDRQAAAKYVMKYATKAVHASYVHEVSLLAHAITVLEGKRSIITFGTWRGRRRSVERPRTDWEIIGTFDHVVGRARFGEACALAILRAIPSVSHSAWMIRLRDPPDVTSPVYPYEVRQCTPTPFDVGIA
jgi:hypothetical protein